MTLWARDAGDGRDNWPATRESPRLPGVQLDDRIAVTGAICATPRSADAILLAVPAQDVRAVAIALRRMSAPRHAGHRLRQGHRARHRTAS